MRGKKRKMIVLRMMKVLETAMMRMTMRMRSSLGRGREEEEAVVGGRMMMTMMRMMVVSLPLVMVS